MRIGKTYIVLQLIAFLVAIQIIISCSAYGDKKSEVPATLPGKWQLLRIEDPYKIVVPPTDVIRVELEISGDQLAANKPVAGVSGNMLSGSFTGTVTYNAAALDGTLDVGTLHVNEDVLLARYRQFDDYYLQQLAHATSYCIEENTLTIRSGDGAELIYTWIGDN